MPIMSVARGMFKVERVPEQIDRVPIKPGAQCELRPHVCKIPQL